MVLRDWICSNIHLWFCPPPHSTPPVYSTTSQAASSSSFYQPATATRTMATVTVGNGCNTFTFTVADPNQPIAVPQYCYYQSTTNSLSVTSTTPTPSTTTTTAQYGTTQTCYLDGCVPLQCPTWGCGSVTVTTISSYQTSTQGVQTFTGTVNAIGGVYYNGAYITVYFLDVGSLQYYLAFPSGTTSFPANGQTIQVTGMLTIPSPLFSLSAPAGQITVQTWT
jgi:hypothetical protein